MIDHLTQPHVLALFAYFGAFGVVTLVICATDPLRR